MQKTVRSFAGKMFLPVSVSCVLLLSGCGGTIGDKDTDEAKKYEVAMALDSADYDKAIELLEKDCAGYDYEECQLNLGSAYLGKAGMDIISLGKDLVKIDGNETDNPLLEQQYEDWRDTQTMTVLFDIITDDAIAQGAKVYKRLLDQNGSECNGVDYETLTTIQQNACIAVNPILLQEILSEDENKTDVAVDIETISQFKDVLEAVIPDVTTADIVSIIDNSEVGDADDRNSNDDVDNMEATECAITAYNDNGNTAFSGYACLSPDTSVLAYNLNQIGFTTTNDTIYGIRVELASNTSYADINFTRLVKEITPTSGIYTTVTTSGYCTVDGATCTAGDSGCYPCPVINEDNTSESLADTVEDVLNNETLLTSIALMSDSDEDTNSTEKIVNFKEDICGDIYNADGTINTTALAASDCEDPENPGEVLISQEALLNYMSK
jgi:hypothetical protein